MKRNLLFGLLITINSVLFAQNPVADFNYTNVCLGSPTSFIDLTTNTPTTWDWAFGDGGISTVQNPTYTYSNPGSYNATLIVYNGAGYDTITKIVNVFPNPSINAGADQTICLGSATTLSASGGISYNWSPTTGLSSPTVPNPSASPTTTTTYTVTVTDINGCSANDMVNITVNPLPNVNAGPDQTICSGSSVGLSASGGLTYNWTPSTGLSNPTTANPIASPTSTTIYTVTATDVNGCSSTDDVTVTVSSAIFLTDNVTNVSCNGMCDGSISIAPTGGNPPFTYNWSPGGITIPNITNLCAGTYTITVTDANGCTEQLNSTVTQPNAITISLGINDISCIGSSDGEIFSTVNGGTPPYAYTWSNGSATTQNISNIPAGTYILNVTDANACTTDETATIDEHLPSSTITGTIYFQTMPITTGLVQLILKNGNLPSDMSIVDTTSVNPTSGEFIFYEVSAGNYLIKALGDTSIYNCAPTYSVGTAQWQLAQVYNIANSCNDSIYVDIDLIELPNLSGTGNINGRLVESGGALQKAPGEPISDIDITVNQSPGGSIMAATSTDIDGYFSFADLPMGTYIIKADMFGYGMDTLQTITFNGTNNSYDVTLCSNDTINMVEMCKMTITGVNEVVTNSLFNIYPNPAKDFLNINNSVGNIKIEITDLTGKIIFKDALQNNFETIDISSFKKGIYIVTLSNPNVKYIQKLVIN